MFQKTKAHMPTGHASQTSRLSTGDAATRRFSARILFPSAAKSRRIHIFTFTLGKHLLTLILRAGFSYFLPFARLPVVFLSIYLFLPFPSESSGLLFLLLYVHLAASTSSQSPSSSYPHS